MFNYKQMKYLFIIIASSIFLYSCNLENKKPEFKRFENVKISNLSSNTLKISAELIVYNPNNISVYLNNTEVDVFVNNIKVSHVSQTENTEILKKSEFKIPLKVNFNLNDLIKNESSIIDIISGSVNVFKDKKIDLKYIGTATFKIANIEFDVPIKYEETLAL